MFLYKCEIIMLLNNFVLLGFEFTNFVVCAMLILIFYVPSFVNAHNISNVLCTMTIIGVWYMICQNMSLET